MASLTQMELNILRHHVGMVDLAAKKFGFYSEQCTDSDAKSFFKTAAQEAESNKAKLMDFLS